MQVPRWLAREGGPRAAVAALALGSALLLPGAIVERVRSAPSHAAWVATPDDSRNVAVFELEAPPLPLDDVWSETLLEHAASAARAVGIRV